MRLSQGRTSDVGRYVDVAYGAAQRAAALTHRLLAFSRRQILVSEHTDVHTLIAEMEELIRRTVGPSVELEVDLAATVSTCHVDPSQVENSLLNLCINSRDALASGGRIWIRTTNQIVEQSDELDSEMAPGTYLTVMVGDNGAGMSPETISKAFEPFFTTKPVGAGTGLGLSMVYGFAKQSGGQVNINSEEGKGTSVFLQLPTHTAQVEAAVLDETPLEQNPCASDETVLVIDDEPSVRMFVTEALGSLGYRVIEAADGVAGLQLLQSDTPIDLLVTDIGLPGGVDGRRMVETGRICRPHLPVLFMTGFVKLSTENNPLQTPLTAVLTKPFTLDVLTSSVSSLLGKRLAG